MGIRDRHYWEEDQPKRQWQPPPDDTDAQAFSKAVAKSTGVPSSSLPPLPHREPGQQRGAGPAPPSTNPSSGGAIFLALMVGGGIALGVAYFAATAAG